jgi:hypothetical protein
MLTYFISGSNGFTVRTQPTASNEYTMSLQDMTQLNNTTASLINVSYDGYESILTFTASIDNTIIGEEYRAKILNSGSVEPIWHGTIQVYSSQSVNKPEYVNQIPLDGNEVSHTSPNEYIILK